MLHLLLCCLLLARTSSAPVSPDPDSWMSSSSDSDESLQGGGASRGTPPTAASHSVMVQVENTRTNVTLSLAIYIITEEEEGWSGADGGGSDNSRSEESSSSSEDDDISSEEMTAQDRQPMTSPLPAEEMMHDQPALSEEETRLTGNFTGSDPLGFTDSTVVSHGVRENGDFGFGSRLLEVLHLLTGSQGGKRSDGGHEVLDSTLTGPVFNLSSDESEESSESVLSGPINQSVPVGSGPDSSESLEINSSVQQTASRDPAKQVSGPTKPPVSDLIRPDSDSREVQDSSTKSPQVLNGPKLDPVHSDQDLRPTMWSMLKGTKSEGGSKSFSRVNVGLNPVSSEESRESVGTPDVGSMKTSRPGPVSRTSDPNVSSSSEEESLNLVSSPSSPPVCLPDAVPPSPPESEISEFGSSMKSSDLSTDPDPDIGPEPVPTTDFHPSPEPTSYESLSSSSEIIHGEPETLPTIRVPVQANSDANANSLVATMATSPASGRSPAIRVPLPANSDANANSLVATMATDLILGVKDSDLSSDADESDDASPDADLLHMHISSGANAESAVSVSPATTRDVRVSSEASLNASSPSPTQTSKSLTVPPPPPPPPRRRKPYRFGYLGPISHSYSNQPVARGRSTNIREKLLSKRPNQSVFFTPQQDVFGLQANRKQNRVSLAALANPSLSSSEESDL